MKKLTKVLALLLAFTLLAAGVAGCGAAGNKEDVAPVEQASPAEGAPAAEAPADGTEAAPAEIYEVVMMWPNFVEPGPGLEDVEAAVNAITEPAIGVRVKFQFIHAMQSDTQTALAVASKEKLDLVCSIGTGLAGKISSGCIMPLNDLVEQYGADIKEATGRALVAGNYGGVLYGVPTAHVTGNEPAYVIRKDMLEKYDIQIEKDKVYDLAFIDEIFAKVYAGEGGSMYMIAGPSVTAGDCLQAQLAYDLLGGTVASGVLPLWNGTDDTKIVNLFETEEYRAFAQRMFDWAQKGYISPDAASKTERPLDEMPTGQYLGWFMGRAVGKEQARATLSAQCGYEVEYLYLHEPLSTTQNFYSQILWSITSTCENPEKTMEFLNYIYKNSDVANLMQFGIEGVSYIVVEEEDGQKVIALPDGETTKTVPYWQSAGVFGNVLRWNLVAPAPIDANKVLKEWSDSITFVSPALGYCFVTDEVSDAYTAVCAVVDQYYFGFGTGSLNPETELPKFIADLKAAGIDSVIEANQKQYDAFLADK